MNSRDPGDKQEQNPIPEVRNHRPVKRRTLIDKILWAILALLLIAAAVGWWKTAPTLEIRKKGIATVAATDLVDQSTYETALRLAQTAVAADEQAYAQSALRIADHELDLAFKEGILDAEAHPPALHSDAAAIKSRISKSQELLSADQQLVNELTTKLAQAKDVQKSSVQDELDLARSQLDLDKDELDEANQDLLDAGGNPRQQIEAMVQEHEAQLKAHPLGGALRPAGAADEQHGSLGKFREWRQLRQQRLDLDDARGSAATKAQALASRRAQLAANLETTKGGIAELAHHTKAAKETDKPAPAHGLQHTHEDAAALLGQTKMITADQEVLTLLDRRIADQHQLMGIYGRWSALIALRSENLVHRLLLDTLIVILILSALLLLDEWLQHFLDNPKLDRRQVETLRSITRMSLRVAAVLIIVIIVLGVPSQFATTIGIVGAGLTVALKDFIVAFFGWLVLMGRNGIRLGDWVEINGVSGEVTELGMFHTVLLETGNWSDSGHPTGRRVTFTNSFAIEGHYFNFSTSGQWLWDQLQVVVPLGRDPYPIVDAITKQVAEVTAESAREAEKEWQRAVPVQRDKVFSGTPGVNVKPVVGGVEIAIRYITRANERFLLRAKLYQAAVDLLGEKPAAPSAPK